MAKFGQDSREEDAVHQPKLGQPLDKDRQPEVGQRPGRGINEGRAGTRRSGGEFASSSIVARRATSRSRLAAWVVGGMLTVIGILARSGVAQAQPTVPSTPVPVAPSPSLVVQSNPSGATVLLHGPYELIGQTPWTLTRDLSGVYRIEVRRTGYESWNGEVVVAPGAGTTLEVDLNRKNRLRAFARSAIIPGWGQTYAGNPERGRILLAAEFLALGGWIYTHELYQSEVDDFEDAAEAYRSATRQEDLPALRRALNRAGRDADRAYDRRQLLVAAAAGVYAVSLLDALFFSPIPGDSGPDGSAWNDTDPVPAGHAFDWTAGMAANQEARVGLNLRW